MKKAKINKLLMSGIIIGVFLISTFAIVGMTTATKPVDYSYAIVQFNEKSIGGQSGGHRMDSYTQTSIKEQLQIIHANFKAWLHTNAPWASSVSDYYYTLNGIAIKYTGNNLQSLAKGPDVKSVTPDSLYYPTMDASVPLIQANQVWSAMGVNPANPTALAKVKVGVIDSGIANVPFITSCRAPIVHDVFYSGVEGNTANTIVEAHGTHVSGTIGGCYTTTPVTVGSQTIQLDGPISGVAPGVTLHDYNVFPGFGYGYTHSGSALSHDIANAVEKAVTDGMNIISMSLGGSVQGPNDLLAQAVNNAVGDGVVAVVAAGNSGVGLPLSVESPGSAANAITVAASTNSHFFAGTKLNIGSHTVYAVEGDFKTFTPAITAPTSLTTPADGCSTISQDLTGKIAIIDRGACYFTAKVDNAEAAGAVGVIVVNNQPGPAIAMAQSGTPNMDIPAVMVSLADGTNYLKPYVPGVITVDSSTLYELPTTPDVIADFSSLGPTPFNFLTKPDVAAPGVNILSSVFGGKFAVYEGTSMATPHITGVAALLLAQNPNLTPAQVKSAIVNNAVRNTNLDFGSFSGFVYGPLAMGGGRVNALNAYKAKVFASPSSISFGGYTGGAPISTSTVLTFQNTQNSPVTLTLTNDNRDGYSNFLVDPQTHTLYYAPWDASNFVSLSATSLVVPAGGSASVTVSFDSGKALSYTGWSFGYVQAQFGTTTMNVPWSIIFQQHNGALNGLAGSGLLVDPSVSQQYTAQSTSNGLST